MGQVAASAEFFHQVLAQLAEVGRGQGVRGGDGGGLGRLLDVPLKYFRVGGAGRADADLGL
ncbi:hypothetical protein ADL21_38000 [Streptomyces albus subsp. albus]|nr:hypothetical protein ADL21_38000 [Streptomyces albus subsp. albus]